MTRSLWTGAISFGLVTIPVRLVSAVQDKQLRLHMLSQDGRCRLRRKLYCPESGEEYDFKETARGYEVAPDEYVLLQNEEIERLKPESGRTINIKDFVDLSDIDPVFYQKPYYLIPDKQGAKAYDLLVRAMEESGRVGIAKFTMRSNEYLAALRVKDGLICLETMRFADEVVASEEVERPEAKEKPDEREVAMAKQLIDMLSGSFDPGKYHDEYRERLEQLVEKKAAGQTMILPEEEEAPRTNVIDLMSVLKASLEEGGKAASSDSAKGGKGGRKKKQASAEKQKKREA